jgi:hypothetical protein
VSANLEQQPEGGDSNLKHYPITFKLQKLSAAQVHLQELLAVVNTLQAFRQYLLPGCWTVCSTFTRTE